MFALLDFVFKYCKNVKLKNWSKWSELPRLTVSKNYWIRNQDKDCTTIYKSTVIFILFSQVSNP
jgi:hypothetical protein